MRTGLEPHAFNPDCPKCYGTLRFPTPWIGCHEYTVSCDCPAGIAERARLGGDNHGLYGGDAHRQQLLVACGRVAWVDEGIAADVERLWQEGIWTWVSCQGDDRRHRYVSVLDVAQAERAREFLPWAAEMRYLLLGGRLSREEALRTPGARASFYGADPPLWRAPGQATS